MTLKCPRCGSENVTPNGSTLRTSGRVRKYQCKACFKGFAEPRATAPVKTAASEENLVTSLQSLGYTVTKEPPKHETFTAPSGRFENLRTLKFAAFSCPHFGSQCQQRTALNTFYDLAAAKGCTHVLCAGDIFDGSGKVYRGQEYELFKHGYDAQLDYVTEQFPKRPGIQTVAIAGNHDASFFSGTGADIVQALAARRSDITYLGQYGGTFKIDKDFSVFLMHGKGGPTRGRTYKIQQIIEGFASEQKPNMLLVGHWHSFAYLPMYRNVIAWQLGCFQSQTPFEKTLGLYPEVGGLIFRVSLGNADRKGGTILIHHEFVPFYVPVENDF